MNKLLVWGTALVLTLTSAAGADNLSQAGFQRAVLANGIPVYFKANPNNQVLALQAYLRGGTALQTPDTAGWEGLALTLLTRGSARYTYEELKDLQWRTSSSLTASASSFDGSSFGLVSLPGAFDKMFDAWSDALTAPAWAQAEFDRVIQDAKISRQQKDEDPYNRAVDELNKVKFAGHPYAPGFDPTPASLDAVTLPDLKAWWDQRFTSGRLEIVAVGAFDFPDLVKKLNATLGQLPKAAAPKTKVGPWKAQAAPVLVPFEGAGDVGYVRADFPVPPVNSADAAALDLGLLVLNDILFDVVRGKYAACYSVWSRYYTFQAPYGSLAVYKTDQPGKVKAYLDEAVGLLASGKALASQASASADGKGGIGTAVRAQEAQYTDLAKVIDFYKAKAVNGFYEGQQTNAAIAGQMAAALLYRGDEKAYLAYAQRLAKVKAGDVVRVIRQYVKNGPKVWVVLAAPSLMAQVDPAQFQKKATWWPF